MYLDAIIDDDNVCLLVCLDKSMMTDCQQPQRTFNQSMDKRINVITRPIYNSEDYGFSFSIELFLGFFFFCISCNHCCFAWINKDNRFLGNLGFVLGGVDLD